ncbi:hypothetical protein D918_02787 [Trichuris suis]|nr:hypothetical protein D918_02787 [Trichuris suis]
MKINPCWILPLLFVLLAAGKDSSSDDSSSSEEKDDLVGDLESNFEDIFPSRPSTACDKQSTKWSQEKKEKAAKNVFNSLLVALEHPSEFTFKKLVVGANCETSGRQETILLMKVKRTVTTSCALVGAVTLLNKVLIYEQMIK